MSIMCVVGTRPEIIKMSPILRRLDDTRRGRRSACVIVHSGQHYNKKMSGIFFEQLGIRKPDHNVEVGSGSQSQQTARMLVGFERLMQKLRPRLVLAQGDTNTVLSAGLSARKLGIAFGHVEAGLRSYDERMPEEINRKVADDCARLCFAPTKRSAQNLLHEGILRDRIYITGNTIIDVVKRNLPIALKRSLLSESGIFDDEESNPLVTLTLHRIENVDEPSTLKAIVSSILELKGCKIVFPIHPRTIRRLDSAGILPVLRKADNLIMRPPLGYFEFLELLYRSKLVVTDSGGVQEEALTLRTSCVTLRENTERPETIEVGGNHLVGISRSKLLAVASRILKQSAQSRTKKDVWIEGNPLGDGRAAERIVKICQAFRPERSFEPVR